MARKFRIAVGLVILAVFLTSALAVPLVMAKSASPRSFAAGSSSGRHGTSSSSTRTRVCVS